MFVSIFWKKNTSILRTVTILFFHFLNVKSPAIPEKSIARLYIGM